jgi:uncharacterized protein
MDLRAEIDGIRIIDHHVHVMDPFYWRDAGQPPPFPPLNEFPGPQTSPAEADRLFSMFSKVYGRPFPATEQDKAELREAYEASLGDEAPLYNRVIDLAGIELVGTLAQSRPILPPGIDPERFRPVALADGLIIPLDNSALKKPRRKCEIFIRMAESSAEILKKELDRHPASFDDYLGFISAAIQWLKDKGVIALKSSCGYWRGLDFDLVDEDEARAVFDARDTSPARYKRLQDFLQIRVLRECGRLGLPFHMHTGAGGQEGFMAGSNPSLLDKLVWHADTGCTLIMLHGGFPYCREAGFMVGGFGRPPRPLYLDTSMMWMIDHIPGALSPRRTLREWLEWGIAPRLIYGSDAITPFRLWMSALCFREDLSAVLTDMVQESLLSEDQALNAAYQILRGNAEAIYDW